MRVSKKNSKNFKKNVKRLAAYSAAAAATVMTTQDRSANAAEVIHDIPDITVAPIGSSRGVFFNMTNGVTSSRFYYSSASFNNFYDFQEGKFALDPVYGGYLYGPAYSDPNAGTLAFIGEVGDKDGYPEVFADPLPGGSSSVSAADNFNAPPETYFSNRYAYLDWANGQNAFAGIRFDLGGSTHFGWAQITRVDSSNFVLHGFGYNDTPGAASHPTNTALIDIKPGSSPNSVNLKSKGVLPVAIFGTADFDVNDVDISTLLFGDPNSGTPLSPVRSALEDVSDDGFEDLSLKFSVADLVESGALGPDTVGGLLTGELLDGTLIAGMGSIRIVPPNGSNGNSLQISAVPEPSSVLLLAAGAAGLGIWRKQKAA